MVAWLSYRDEKTSQYFTWICRLVGADRSRWHAAFEVFSVFKWGCAGIALPGETMARPAIGQVGPKAMEKGASKEGV